MVPRKFLGFQFWMLLFKLWLQLLLHWELARAQMPYSNVKCWMLNVELWIMRQSQYMSANDIKYLVLHCSASRCNQDYSVEQLRRDHKARGFYDIGYHFYIRKDGTMTQHRMLLEVGAHARPYNRCSIGICYEGGLDEQGKPCNTMTTEQETRLIDLFRNLKILFPKAKIVGHRDLPGTTPKECPCLDAGSWAAHHHLD